MERFKKIYEQGFVEVMEIWVDTEPGSTICHPQRQRSRLYAAAGPGRQARCDTGPLKSKAAGKTGCLFFCLRLSVRETVL